MTKYHVLISYPKNCSWKHFLFYFFDKKKREKKNWKLICFFLRTCLARIWKAKSCFSTCLDNILEVICLIKRHLKRCSTKLASLRSSSTKSRSKGPCQTGPKCWDTTWSDDCTWQQDQKSGSNAEDKRTKQLQTETEPLIWCIVVEIHPQIGIHSVNIFLKEFFLLSEATYGHNTGNGFREVMDDWGFSDLFKSC